MKRNKNQERDCRDLSDALTCYYSDHGCFKIPVRLIVEKPPTDIVPRKGQTVEVEGIMLCREHSATYVVKDALIDQLLVSPEMLKQFEEMGI